MKNVLDIIEKLKRAYPELQEEPLLDQLAGASDESEAEDEPQGEDAWGDEVPEWEVPEEDAEGGLEPAPEDEEPKAKRKAKFAF